MKTLTRVATSGCLLLLVAATASAQMGMRQGPPQMRGIWNPVVGAGAAYEIQPRNGQKTNMEIAIVGKESVEGKDGFWYEMTMNDPRMGGEMVVKNLFVIDGSNAQVHKTIMQMSGHPPMEMPM